MGLIDVDVWLRNRTGRRLKAVGRPMGARQAVGGIIAPLGVTPKSSVVMAIVTRNILYRKPVDFASQLPIERTAELPLSEQSAGCTDVRSGLSYPLLPSRTGPQNDSPRQPTLGPYRPEERLLV